MRPLPHRLVTEIERRLRERHVHGLALLAFDRDGARFGGGVGFADLDRGERVSTETVFRVASVSKQLTTAVILRAIGAGRLDLDQPVNDRLPDAQQVLDHQGRPASFALRTLLSHTSGLPPSVRGATFDNLVLTRLVNGAPLRSLEAAVTGLRVVRGPGERIVYANSGFNLAGHLAALAFGAPFEEVAREQVLSPLGMDRSEFGTHRNGPGVATPYGSLVPPGVSSKSAAGMQLVATPMGGLTTTAADLARFGRMILGGGALEGDRILDESLVTAATTLEATNHPDLEQGYGLGFKVRTWRGRPLVGHDGNMPGVASQLWLSPDDGVGVVVLTNGFALGIPHEIALIALDELVEASDDDISSPPTLDPHATSTFGRDVAGRYQAHGFTPPGVLGALARFTTRVQVTHEADGLLRVDGHPGADGPMWLRPEGLPGRYRASAAVDDGTNAVFERRADGVSLWVGHTALLRRP